MPTTCTIEPRANKKQKFITFLPLLLVELYLIVTLFLYQFGPYPWPTKNPQLFWALIILYHVAFIVGYCLCMRTRHVERETIHLDQFVIRFIKYLLLLGIFISLITIVRDFALPNISLGDILDRFIYGLTKPEEAYLERLQTAGNAAYGGQLMTVFLIVFSFAPALAIPLGLIYFRKIDLFSKILFLANIALEIIHWVGIGTNKGMFDLCIIFVVVLGIKLLQFLYYNKLNRGKVIVAVAIILIILILFLFSFANTIGSRLADDSWLSYPVGGIYPTKDCALFKIVPDSLQKPVGLLTMYTTQGYYAMSMALELDWNPMFGVGGEMFLQEYIYKYTDIDIAQFSYAGRLASSGWHPTVNWHSMYLWVANDLSFFGVILYMFAFGFFFAYFYRESLKSKNSLAIIIFVSLCIMALFIPANNQIFGFLNSAIRFLYVIVFYILFFKTQKSSRLCVPAFP